MWKRWGWEEVAVIMAGAAAIIVGSIKEKEPKMKKVYLPVVAH